MAKSRRSHRSRKSRKERSRRMRGGQAPVNYSNPGPMALSLEQGKQFAGFHKAQHGGVLNTSGAYPGVVEQASVLPSSLVASAKLEPLNQAFDYIKQFGPSSDNPNLRGGRRRSSRKSRKSRSSRKQRGGVLVRWGGGRKASRKGRKASRKGRKASRKGRKASRKGRKSSRRSRRMRGGSYAEMRFPMAVADESKMLLPSGLESQAAASMNPEWRLAANPMSFAPKM